MKKLILSLIALISVTYSFADDIPYADIAGKWSNDSISITFTKDTLYIDEYGNEGCCYTYGIDGEYIIYQSCIDKLYNVFNILKISYYDDKSMGIKFEDNAELFEFDKIK